uniref:Methyltransferase FkbM domain-containing protein n=1 Tax=viral metagenome TaxID=1070528 RepID=A0A6C0JJV2_9ZZZZ
MNRFARGELDKFIYDNCINNVLEDGVAIEIGGHDGGWLSISRFFERELKFKTILVEPIKRLFEQSKINRPNSVHLNYAVSKKRGFTNIVKPSNDNIQEISSLEDGLNVNWKQAWGLTKIEQVTSLHMQDIIDETQLSYVDLFVIDVEGHELDVLETTDFNKVEVGIITIEMLSTLPTYPYFKEKDDQCRAYLKSKGFIHAHSTTGDEIWVNPNYSRKNKLFTPK